MSALNTFHGAEQGLYPRKGSSFGNDRASIHFGAEPPTPFRIGVLMRSFLDIAK